MLFQTYPVPPFEPVSPDYLVNIGGESLHVSPVRVSAMGVDQIFRGIQRPLDETELASRVAFSGEGAIEMRVTVGFDVFRACVVPASAGVETTVDGREVRFTLPAPGAYILEINGVHKPLHIFYDPIEKDAPDPKDENVVYFAPGLHRAGRIELKSGQTLYVAAGARVLGHVVIEDAENVRVCGRGVIDVSNVPRLAAQNAIYMGNARHVRVEDVTLHDAPCFAVTAANCEYVEFDNVKVVGQWRYNSDGIDLYNSRHMYLRKCFIRTFDDSVVLKGGHNVRGHAMEGASMCDIRVEDCVLWNDWGRALEIGAETVAHEMYDITFKRCDVVHFLFIACDVQACGDAHVHDIVFDDIRVGEPLDPQCEPRLTEIFLRPMCWLSVEKLGHVSNITFKNIAYTGRTMVPNRFIGFTAESDVRGVKLENVTINGEALTEKGHPMSGIIYNEFVSDITVDGKSADLGRAHFESDEETCRSFLIGNGAFIKL